MSGPLYSLTAVEMSYGARTVLRIPDLAIRRGEVFALVGPSGCGKSTLLRLLALLETPTAGRVQLTLNGAPVTARSASLEDRRAIAMVFQTPVLLSRSVYSNVAYGLRLRGEQDSAARIEAALRQVSLLPLAGAHARTLSGGEAQRAALARALVLEPSVLLLDEPTANLDPANGRLIEDAIRAHHDRRGATVLIATHNLFQARRLADRVLLLLDGQPVEVGPTEQFFNAPQDPRTATFLSGDLIY